jgi:hypothetical protein
VLFQSPFCRLTQLLTTLTKFAYGSKTYPGLTGTKALSSLGKVCPALIAYIPNCGIRVQDRPPLAGSKNQPIFFKPSENTCGRFFGVETLAGQNLWLVY